MGAFVITKRFDGFYKFVFTSRNGNAIFTSLKFKLKEECENGIDDVKLAIQKKGYLNFKGTNGKCFFKIVVEGRELAVSRKFTTELRLQKGLDEIFKYSTTAEILDFSNLNNIFSEEEILG